MAKKQGRKAIGRGVDSGGESKMGIEDIELALDGLRSPVVARLRSIRDQRKVLDKEESKLNGILARIDGKAEVANGDVSRPAKARGGKGKRTRLGAEDKERMSADALKFVEGSKDGVS